MRADLVAAETAAPPRPITANARAFRVLVRNALWRRVELVARDDLAGLVAAEEQAAAAAEVARDKLSGGESETPPRMGRDEWDAALDAYYGEHDEVLLDADARGPGLLLITELAGRRWEVRQVLCDPEGNRDWSILAEVDLDASDAAGDLVLRTVSLARLD